MILIGVDPALVHTGVAVIQTDNQRSFKIVATEEIQTSTDDTLPVRLQQIYRAIKKQIEQYHPTVMVIEKIYSHHRHPQTVSILGHVRGVICLLVAEHGLMFKEYSSTRMSKAIVGRGQATPEQMKLMIQRLCALKEPIASEHIVDALALAITDVYQQRWESITARNV